MSHLTCHWGDDAENVSRPLIMTEDERRRRNELRRRPEMMMKARELGLLTEDEWTVVTRHGRREVNMWYRPGRVDTRCR